MEMTEEEVEKARIEGEEVRTTAGGKDYKGKIVARIEGVEETSFIFDGSAMGRESEGLRLRGGHRDFSRPVRR